MKYVVAENNNYTVPSRIYKGNKQGNIIIFFKKIRTYIHEKSYSQIILLFMLLPLLSLNVFCSRYSVKLFFLYSDFKKFSICTRYHLHGTVYGKIY